MTHGENALLSMFVCFVMVCRQTKYSDKIYLYKNKSTEGVYSF